jgi:uncharacterized protein DUF1707
MRETPASGPGPGPGPGPRSFASEADRERLLYLLREHFAHGQLDLGDMSTRVGIVLAATYTDEAAAAVSDLPLLVGPAAKEQPSGPPRRARIGQRRRHAQRTDPGAAWVPTPERFRDPSTRAITRVWIDPVDMSRHYVPEPDG